MAQGPSSVVGLHPPTPALRIGHLPGPERVYDGDRRPRSGLLSRLLAPCELGGRDPHLPASSGRRTGPQDSEPLLTFVAQSGLRRHAVILVLAQTDGEAESDEEPARNL
jgi:hypothetical protein